MTGLEERLRRIAGVADLTLELGDEGLSGITVRMRDGSDESTVLEEIRRILVAYGLGDRRSAFRPGPVGELRLRAEASAEPADPAVEVRPGPEGLVVILSTPDRRVTARGPASPEGATEAMASAVAEWIGRHPIRDLSVRRLRVDDDRVLVVVLRGGGRSTAGAAVEAGDLGGVLYRAVRSAYAEV